MDSLPDGAVRGLRQLIRDLVNGEYTKLEADGRAGRLTGLELREATDHYHRRLSLPPEEGLADIDVVEVENQGKRTWSVDVEMWTEEDGKSDWVLSITVTQERNGTFIFAIDDLHVL